MTPLILIAALTILPQGELPERCDLIECNHFFDSDGREVFVQHLAWDWHARHGCHHIATWALCKQEQARHCYTSGDWIVCMKERQFRAPVYRETWTQHDPELLDRERWPVANRRLR